MCFYNISTEDLAFYCHNRKLYSTLFKIILGSPERITIYNNDLTTLEILGKCECILMPKLYQNVSYSIEKRPL